MRAPPTEETFNDLHAESTGPRAVSAAQLFLLLECGRPLAGGARHTLANLDEVVLGRAAGRVVAREVEQGTRRLVLGIADRRISTQHARLVRDGATWRYEDHGSRNGSRLNGATVVSAVLADGDVLELGQTFFVFRAALPIAANTAGDLDTGELVTHETPFATLLPGLRAAFDTVLSVARSNVSVLLLGETGTGKELCARAVHERSGRRGELVAINCGALPANLLEAQLFGHVKGAFSGATRDELGYVRAAHQGTLFLDEVGDLPLSSQVALLRVLEAREVVPVGSTRPVPVDLRIVAATHAPLEALVDQGAFRNDLLGRLAGFSFRLPALRERREDLGLLIARLLPELAQEKAESVVFAPEALRAFMRYGWPRNVRELKQCLASALVLADGGPVLAEHIPSNLSAVRTPSEHAALRTDELAAGDELPSQPRVSAEVRIAPEDQALYEELLARFTEQHGNVTRVASSMGKARVQIQRWIKRFGIDPGSFR